MRTHEKQGMSRSEYKRVHTWLSRQCVKSDACAMCGGNDNLQNALIKGKRYEANPNNYMTLCAKCHSFYDTKQQITDKPIVDAFCQSTGISRTDIEKLFKAHPSLRSKIKGEQKPRVNMVEWGKLEFTNQYLSKQSA